MSLPYVFDLIWDIKDIRTLKDEYWRARRKVSGLEDMASQYDIDLGEFPPWEDSNGQ